MSEELSTQISARVSLVDSAQSRAQLAESTISTALSTAIVDRESDLSSETSRAQSAEADISATEIVAILTPVIRAGGNDVDEKEVGNAVWQAGLADGIAACSEILTEALGAGGDEGNVSEAEALP